MRSVIATVVSRVEPPAPYVTETNVGDRPSSRRSACHRSRSPAGVFGGKNSKEYDRSPPARSSRMVETRVAGARSASRVVGASGMQSGYGIVRAAGSVDTPAVSPVDLRERVDKALHE